MSHPSADRPLTSVRRPGIKDQAVSLGVLVDHMNGYPTSKFRFTSIIDQQPAGVLEVRAELEELAARGAHANLRRRNDGVDAILGGSVVDVER